MRRGFPNAATALFVALGAALFAPGDAVAGYSVTVVRGEASRHATAHTLVQPSSRRVTAIERRVAEPAATIGQALSQQPVHPDLCKVRIVHTTLWLDPDENYIQNMRCRFDHNHAIPAAQRLACSLRQQGVYAVRGRAEIATPRGATPIRPIRLSLPAPREQVPDNRSEPARVATATNPSP